MTTVSAPALSRTSDHRGSSSSFHNRVGPAIAVVGLTVAVATAIAEWSTIGDVGSDDATVTETGMRAGGLGILGIGIIKVAIGVVLVGIVTRLWNRADSVQAAVPNMRVRDSAPRLTESFGRTQTSADIPAPLPIHRMATRMWRPMFVMGAMAVLVGAIVRFAAAAETAGTDSFRELSAWGLGFEFLGETMLLAGISFLLGTILASLRQAGSEVQKAAGVPIRVLAMSKTAKAFIGLMMVGVMIGIGQFIASIVLADKASDPASFSELAAFVGPVREVALGVVLSGVVLALATIGTVLTFQFDRVRDLVRHN